jgi:hypothetical protein
MNNSTKSNKFGLFVMMFITAALIGSIVTISSADQNSAFATKSKKSNEALQGLSQESFTGSSAECFSNNNTLASCNNVALSLNGNDGNNANGQQ